MLALAPALTIPSATAVLLIVVLLLLGKVPLGYNLRNLTLRWKTTLMTALAFTLVIALLTVMLAFVNGMYALTQASGHPDNVVILSDGATDEVFSNLKPVEVGDIDHQPGVARDSLGRPLASREIFLIVNQAIPDAPPGQPKGRRLQFRGIENTQMAAVVHGISLQPLGKWFSDAGVESPPNRSPADDSRRTAVQVVLGWAIARDLGRGRAAAESASARNRDRLDVGDAFSLDERSWIVVGVMQPSGSTFDSEIWAKAGVIGPMFGKETYTTVTVRAEDAAKARTLKNFYANHYKTAAIQAQVETDYFANLGESNRQFLYGIAVVTVIMAVGGVFGVMNTMFAAISQRTKDIGVLRLLGYNRRQILVSFLLESLVIALIGGGTGCALGSLSDGWTANSFVSSGPGGGKFVVLKLSVNATIIATGAILTLVMGALGGLLPALSAIRLRPLEALR